MDRERERKRRKELLLYAHTHQSILRAAGHNFTDTSDPVVGFGANNMVIVPFGIETNNLLITSLMF
jgi:hypothetical protein